MKDHMHLGMSTLVARLGETGQRICRFIADAASLGCCLLLVHGAWKLVLIGMDDRAPVTGVPIGLINACLLVSSAGMAVLLVHSLWRLLSGRMPRSELVNDTGSAGE
jgi:TRAP-type C4-dicarboxylate transport system permease small subunit